LAAGARRHGRDLAPGRQRRQATPVDRTTFVGRPPAAGRGATGARRPRTLAARSSAAIGCRLADRSAGRQAPAAHLPTEQRFRRRRPRQAMRNLIRAFQSYWLADASFVTLLVMLVAVVFVLPVVMGISAHGVLLFNILLLGVFFSGIFSTRNIGLISLSAVLFAIHLALRVVRFGDNPYSFFVLENVVAIANILVFVFINLRLLFRDQIVNTYRIIGAVNVYLLLALMGALTLEVIHASTGISIAGNIVLNGTDDDYVHFIYFSTAALTTVGFGDVFAVSTPAKMLATFLSTLGVLFPAIVIARLVGLASSRS
jgi:hypothetical protein